MTQFKTSIIIAESAHIKYTAHQMAPYGYEVHQVLALPEGNAFFIIYRHDSLNQ